MSVNIPINQVDPTAPTPQNTPLTHAPIAQGLSRPTVPDITEDNEPDEDEPEAGAIQKAMLGLVHGKLSGLVGKSSGYIESLPVEVKKNIEALKGVQVKQVELQNQYKRECLELEKKVRRRYPVFCVRCVCGERGVAMRVIESREGGDSRAISSHSKEADLIVAYPAKYTICVFVGRVAKTRPWMRSSGADQTSALKDHTLVVDHRSLIRRRVALPSKAPVAFSWEP